MNSTVLQADGNTPLYSVNEKRHYFACLLRHILGLAALRPNADYHADLFRRQVEFVNNLLAGGNDHLTYDLRIVSRPDPLVSMRGRVTVAMICRVDEPSREEAERHAAETLRLLEASFEEYEFELADCERIKRLLCPFSVQSIVAVSRRSRWQKLDTLNGENGRSKCLGFNSVGARSSNKGSDFKDSVFHIYPLVPSHLSWDTLFKLLLLQPMPIAISCRLRPTTTTVEEKAFLENQIAICERYAQLSLGLLPEDPSSLWPTLREQARMYQHYQWHTLQGLRSNPAFMTLEIASPDPIPPTVVHAVGAAVTQPADASISGQAIEGLAGGWETVDLGSDSRNMEAFEQLNIMWSVCPSVPVEAARLPYLFDATEAAACFRLPTPTLEGPPGLEIRTWHELPPPGDLPQCGTLIGETACRGVSQAVRIGSEDRFRSVYMIGKTGVGKTRMLATMALDDMEAGKGLCVIDPHGDLYRELVERIPAHRIEDVVLFDPTDIRFPLALNLLECDSELQRHFLIQEMVGIILRLIEDEFGYAAVGQFAGPVFLQHMRMNLLLVMSDPEDPGTLLEFHRIYQDKDYWKRWLPLRTKDPQLEHWAEKVLPRTDYLAQGNDGVSLGGYVGSKFEEFIFDPRLRNIFGQKRSTINLREIMDTGKILLVNLAKGELTEANSRFLGMLLLAKLQAAAVSRVSEPQEKRKEFLVYVDEASTIASQNFVSLLSEGRKFRLGLILANQYIAQIRDPRIIESILNVGTILAFRLGQPDAEIMEREMFPDVSRSDLLNLPNYHAYMRTLVSGKPARPFSMRTVLPSTPGSEKRALEVQEFSRQKYGRPRREVEKEIAQSSENSRQIDLELKDFPQEPELEE